METVTTGTHLSLALHGRDDITGGSAALLYRKPGATAAAELAVEIVDPAQASCLAQITSAIHDVPGIWRTWLKTTNAEGRVGYGRTYRFRSVQPGS